MAGVPAEKDPNARPAVGRSSAVKHSGRPLDRVQRRYAALVALYALALAALVTSPITLVPLWEIVYRRGGFGYRESHELVVDVVLNVVAFLPLGFLLHGSYRGDGVTSRRTLTLATATAAALAIAAEATQWALAWRRASALDVVIDVAAAAAGAVLQALLRRTRRGAGDRRPS